MKLYITVWALHGKLDELVTKRIGQRKTEYRKIRSRFLYIFYYIYFFFASPQSSTLIEINLHSKLMP